MGGKEVKKVVVFDCEYTDIPRQDLPLGNVIVCVAARGDEPWVAGLVTRDGHLVSYGLFWHKSRAVQFAELISDEVTEDL